LFKNVKKQVQTAYFVIQEAEVLKPSDRQLFERSQNKFLQAMRRCVELKCDEKSECWQRVDFRSRFKVYFQMWNCFPFSNSDKRKPTTWHFVDNADTAECCVYCPLFRLESIGVCETLQLIYVVLEFDEQPQQG